MIWWILPAIAGVVGLMLVFGGLGKVFKLQPFSGGARLLFGVGFMGVAGILSFAGLNLQTYKRLTYERPVANITFAATGEPNTYRADIILEGDTAPLTGEGFENLSALRGDEWALGARVIKFQPLSNMLGYDSVYKLDRFAVGFEGDEGRVVNRTVVRLSENPGMDVRAMARQYGGRFGIHDASYGSAVYNPMADGLSYDIYMTQDALIARSANAATRARIGEPLNPIGTPTAASED